MIKLSVVASLLLALIAFWYLNVYPISDGYSGNGSCEFSTNGLKSKYTITIPLDEADGFEVNKLPLRNWYMVAISTKECLSELWGYAVTIEIQDSKGLVLYKIDGISGGQFKAGDDCLLIPRGLNLPLDIDIKDTKFTYPLKGYVRVRDGNDRSLDGELKLVTYFGLGP